MTTLLLHPVGLDTASWQWSPIVDALAIDLPGHSKTPLGEPETLEDIADAVLVDARKAGNADAEPFDIVGLSLGGMVAMHLALRHPKHVRSLVIACAPAR